MPEGQSSTFARFAVHGVAGTASTPAFASDSKALVGSVRPMTSRTHLLGANWVERGGGFHTCGLTNVNQLTCWGGENPQDLPQTQTAGRFP